MSACVLIVDDAPDKRRLLREALVGFGVSDQLVFEADDAASARRALKDRYYDLMLLDVLLPSRRDSIPAADVSADFLREILEDETSPAPGRVVAVTADCDVVKNWSAEFNRMVTQVLEVSPGVDDWRYSLNCLITHIASAEAASRQYDFDVCFQATLRDPELEQLKRVGDVCWSPEEPLSDGLLYQRGELEVEGRVLKVACAHAPQMGLVASTHLATTLIEVLRPRVMVMTGICGAVGKDSKLGDVIVADKSWDWQAGKWSAAGALEIAPDQKDGSAQLVVLSRGIQDDLNAAFDRFDLAKPPSPPAIRVAPIASGSAVVADPAFHALFKKQHRKVDGIDMECYGFYYAAHLASTPRPEVLCIKVVSDRADADKADHLQQYGSYMSGVAAFAVLRRYFSPRA